MAVRSTTTIRVLGAHQLALVAAILVLTTVGCGDAGTRPEARAAVEEAVRGYLDALSRTYSSFDLSHLEGHASPNEIEAVTKTIRQLGAGGDRLEATLLGLEFEAVEVFREVNATARLVEVWDVRRLDAFTGREKGRNPSSIQYTILQLRRVDGQWLVVGRSILDREMAPEVELVEPTVAPETTAPSDAAVSEATP
jgi:hypothetical protein